jgi:hypothetical protein
MAIAEFEVHGIEPDKFDFHKLQGIRYVHGQDVTLAGHFIFAGGAGTQPSQERSNVTRFVPVRPEDLELIRGELLDLGGSGPFGIERRHYSTSRTGAE